jgi:hypothetical protein
VSDCRRSGVYTMRPLTRQLSLAIVSLSQSEGTVESTFVGFCLGAEWKLEGEGGKWGGKQVQNAENATHNGDVYLPSQNWYI